jgi:adenylate cyclase
MRGKRYSDAKENAPCQGNFGLSASIAIERRLAAIFAADVAGYSKLMAADEVATLQSLTDCRRVLDQTIAAHRGRIANTAGDSVLAEFPTVGEAVSCAIDAQSRLREANSSSSPDRQINFRVGVHLGDVMIKDGDMFGDGVNIAARLQAEAPPGGVVVSRIVRDTIDGRVPADFMSLGELNLRNIERPVGAFRMEWQSASAPAETRSEQRTETRPTDKLANIIAASGKPSIAVLPFQNLSGDPEQVYFADGLAEDIINELSRFRTLFVIARNSSFAYRGANVDARQVARELGVRYVLDGSVRRAGKKVRVAAQLMDATSGGSMWAERYDCDIEDVFAVQDEVVRKISAVLPGRLEDAEFSHVTRKTSESLEAYDLLLQGKYFHHLRNAEANLQAEACFDRSIAKDPNFAEAIAWKACTIGQAWNSEFVPRDPARFAEMNRLTRRALELDENDAECHRIMCRISLTQRQFDRSERHLERALALTPNDPRLIVQRGVNLTYLGSSESALPWIEQALRIDPFSASRYENDLVRALYAANHITEAVSVLESSTLTHYEAFLWKAACYSETEREADAKSALREALSSRPHLTVASVMEAQPWKRTQDTARIEAALSRAGLPR